MPDHAASLQAMQAVNDRLIESMARSALFEAPLFALHVWLCLQLIKGKTTIRVRRWLANPIVYAFAALFCWRGYMHLGSPIDWGRWDTTLRAMGCAYVVVGVFLVWAALSLWRPVPPPASEG